MSLPIDLADQVIEIVAPHPAVPSIELAGSRAAGAASEFSDWDFRVEANDFPAAADSLPDLLAPLQPLAQQWDRLSSVYCWMLIVHGAAKVDLIFSNEPHTAIRRGSQALTTSTQSRRTSETGCCGSAARRRSARWS